MAGLVPKFSVGLSLGLIGRFYTHYVGLSPLIIHLKSPEENSPLGMSLKYYYWMLKREDSGILITYNRR